MPALVQARERECLSILASDPLRDGGTILFPDKS